MASTTLFFFFGGFKEMKKEKTIACHSLKEPQLKEQFSYFHMGFLSVQATANSEMNCIIRLWSVKNKESTVINPKIFFLLSECQFFILRKLCSSVIWVLETLLEQQYFHGRIFIQSSHLKVYMYILGLIFIFSTVHQFYSHQHLRC